MTQSFSLDSASRRRLGHRLIDAIDRYFSREADRDLAENPDAPTYSMSEVVAAIFEEEPGKGAT